MMMMNNLQRRQSSWSPFSSSSADDLPLRHILLHGGTWFVLGFMTLATTTTSTTTAVAAYVLSSPKHHHYYRQEASSSRQTLQQQHCLVAPPPPVFSLKKSSSSSSPSSWFFLTLLSATNPTRGQAGGFINSTQHSDDNSNTSIASSSSSSSPVVGVDDTNKNDGASSLAIDASISNSSTIISSSTNSSSSNASSSMSSDQNVTGVAMMQQATPRFRQTLQDMATAIRGRLQRSWGLPIQSKSNDTVTETIDDQNELLESLLQKVQFLQYEMDHYQQETPTISQNKNATQFPQLETARQDVQGQQQQQQSPPPPHELLEMASLKLKQYAQQRQALQLEMVALKEHYESQITILQERLQLPQDALEREALLYQQHEQEIELLQETRQQERLDAERRIGQILAQGRHDVLAIETKYKAQLAALDEKLVNTTCSLDHAMMSMSLLQINVSQLQVQNEELRDDIILLNATQYSVRKLVQCLGSLLWSRTVQRVRRALTVSSSSSSPKQQQQQQQQQRQQQQQQNEGDEELLPLSLKYQSVALKKTARRK